MRRVLSRLAVLLILVTTLNPALVAQQSTTEKYTTPCPSPGAKKRELRKNNSQLKKSSDNMIFISFHIYNQNYISIFIHMLHYTSAQLSLTVSLRGEGSRRSFSSQTSKTFQTWRRSEGFLQVKTLSRSLSRVRERMHLPGRQTSLTRAEKGVYSFTK